MSVYVDDMRAKFGRLVMCHMVADSDEELHAMAARIGVARRWFQGPPHHARQHYDIALSKRALAVQYGALEITWRQCGAMTHRRLVTGALGSPDDAVAWLQQRSNTQAVPLRPTSEGISFAPCLAPPGVTMPRKPKDPNAPPKTRKSRKAAAAAPTGAIPPPWESVPGAPPVTVVTDKKILKKVGEWMTLKGQIEAMAPVVAREMELRKELGGLLCPSPREGTNNVELPDGWKMKYRYNLDRQYDMSAMAATFAQLPDGTADYLINWKPYLKTENFRRMPEDQRAILEQCIITKPGSPVLELIGPEDAVTE